MTAYKQVDGASCIDGPAVGAIMECAIGGIKGLMVFVVEILVAQIKGIACAGAFHLNVGDQCIEVKVGCHHIIGGVFAPSLGRYSPATIGLSFGNGHIGHRMNKRSDGGIFLHELRTDYRTINIIIGKGKVGFEHTIDVIGDFLSIGSHHDAGHCAAVGCGISDTGNFAIVGHDVGKRVALAYHLFSLGNLYGCHHVALGIFLADVGSKILHAIDLERSKRRGLRHIHVAIDIELHEISILVVGDVGELQLAVGAVYRNIHITSSGGVGYT